MIEQQTNYLAATLEQKQLLRLWASVTLNLGDKYSYIALKAVEVQGYVKFYLQAFHTPIHTPCILGKRVILHSFRLL
jgi:hypothetical protein